MADSHAQVLFIVSAFPGTLLPAAVTQTVALLSVLICSVPLGRTLDMHPRLNNLRVSILVQRITVVLSCMLYYVLNLPNFPMNPALRVALFAFVVVTSSLERLAAKANTITMERDWVRILLTI